VSNSLNIRESHTPAIIHKPSNNKPNPQAPAQKQPYPTFTIPSPPTSTIPHTSTRTLRPETPSPPHLQKGPTHLHPPKHITITARPTHPLGPPHLYGTQNPPALDPARTTVAQRPHRAPSTAHGMLPHHLPPTIPPQMPYQSTRLETPQRSWISYWCVNDYMGRSSHPGHMLAHTSSTRVPC